MTPVTFGSASLGSLPEWLEMYLRAIPGRTSFSLFPWPAYLFVGVVVGSWLATPDADAESRINRRLGLFGLLLAAVGGLATQLPPFAGQPTPMTISPSFFCVRLGLVMLAVPIARAWHERRTLSWSPLREFGVASLFVYWIHVEMAYGRPSQSIHRGLSFGEAAAATLVLMVGLYGLVRLKAAVTSAWPPKGRSGSRL